LPWSHQSRARLVAARSSQVRLLPARDLDRLAEERLRLVLVVSFEAEQGLSLQAQEELGQEVRLARRASEAEGAFHGPQGVVATLEQQLQL
jgi:hypothetical protein